MGEIKKIAFFTGIFHPESGGPATYLYKLCGSLTEKGYKIKLLSFGEKQDDSIYPYLVKRISRKYPIPLRLLVYFLYVIKFAVWADLLFISDYGFPAAIVNLFLKKKTIIKIVGDFAWEKAVRDRLTKDNIDDFQIKKQSWLAEFYKKLQKFYVSKMDKIITPSNYLKGIIGSWGIPADKISVIYNAIESRFTPDLARHASPGLKRGKILLTVARLVPWKGIDKVISVLPEINKEFPKIRYQIIGDGPDQNRLQNLARQNQLTDQIEFLGKRSNEEVLSYMKDADLFILYSDYEGLPHVILEAMSVGLPALVSSRGGNPEVIEIGRSGMVCENYDNLYKDIIGMLKNPQTVNEIPKELTWGYLIKRVESLFDEIK